VFVYVVFNVLIYDGEFKMKKNINASVMAITLVFASSAVMAEDSIKVRAGFANNNYELNLEDGSTFVGGPVKTTNLGITFLTSETGYVDISISSGSGDSTETLYPRPAYALDRSDFAIVFGSNKLHDDGKVTNMYIGYKSGETTMVSPEDASWWGNTINFEAAGLVVGGGLAIPVPIGGAVSLTGGLGLMSGDYSYSLTSGYAYSKTADYTFGFSYGIGYTYPINNSVGVSVDYKASSYSYTFDAGLSTEEILDEKISGVGVSIYAKF
jgi:hypothetical protein